MRLPLQLPLLCLACSMVLPAAAQETQARDSAGGEGPIRVVPAENVKFDYAQVLRVERLNLERQIRDGEREFQRSQNEFLEDLNLRRNEEYGALSREVLQKAQEYARAEKYDLLVISDTGPIEPDRAPAARSEAGAA